MRNVFDEFRYRRSFVLNMNYKEADSRLSSFLDWLETNEVTQKILAEITNEAKAVEMLKKSDFHTPPSASSPEDFAIIGLHFIREVKAGKGLWGFSHTYGIHPPYNTNSVQAMADEVISRYIRPAINYVAMRLEEIEQETKIKEREKNEKEFAVARVVARAGESETYPPEIKVSLKKFQNDYPYGQKTAFVMMQFGKTPAHQNIVEAIKQVFDRHGLVAVRADDKEYHSSLLGNVLTYIYGCDIGIAVFERIEADKFNPNVSFEVGYMRALGKPICLLKDRTMNTLHTDLLGELYKSFDPQDPKGSIPAEVEKWLQDREIV